MNKTNDIFHTINNGLNSLRNNNNNIARETRTHYVFNVFLRSGLDSLGLTNAFDAIFRLIFLDYLLSGPVSFAQSSPQVEIVDVSQQQSIHHSTIRWSIIQSAIHLWS